MNRSPGVQRLVFTIVAVTALLGLGVAPANAAGGAGAAECSYAGNPATDPNPGLMIREHLPFGGSGNEGSNPGFNFNGFSGCKP